MTKDYAQKILFSKNKNKIKILAKIFGSFGISSYLCSVRMDVLAIRAESREGKTISTLPIKIIKGASNETPLIVIEGIFS